MRTDRKQLLYDPAKEDLLMRTRDLALGACTALLLLACAPKPSEPESLGPPYAPAERIAGTWQWVRSLNVNTTQVHSPSTEGFTAELTFVADGPRGGSFTYQRTGMPTTTGRFTIDSEDGPGNDFITVDTSIDFLTRNAWIAAGQDSLRLGGIFESGYNSVYARPR